MWLSRYLYTFGKPESEVGALLRDLMTRGRSPDVGTSAQLGVIGIRITAGGAHRDEVQTLLDDTERVVRARLGTAVFGRDGDTLASAVGELLVAAGATLATAESCTGGLIGELVTDIPGSSRYYLGGVVTYANEAKLRLLRVPQPLLDQHGAVSEPVARSMAAGAREVLGSTYALSVTGVAGPAGGSVDKPVGSVLIGLATPTGVRVEAHHLGSNTPRRMIRLRAAGLALNLLRLELCRGANVPCS